MGECEYCDDLLCNGSCTPEPGIQITLIGLGALSLLLLLLLAKLLM